MSKGGFELDLSCFEWEGGSGVRGCTRVSGDLRNDLKIQ